MKEAIRSFPQTVQSKEVDGNRIIVGAASFIRLEGEINAYISVSSPMNAYFLALILGTQQAFPDSTSL